MNNGIVVLALLCCLAAVGLYGASIATSYWSIWTIGTLLGSVKINKGLFTGFCDISDCSATDVENFIKNGDVESKVAAAGVILAALCSVIAIIILACSMCNKSSGGAKAAATFCIFAVIFIAAGIATYAVRTTREQNPLVDIVAPVSFGYSLYLAAAAGGANVIATIAACAGA